MTEVEEIFESFINGNLSFSVREIKAYGFSFWVDLIAMLKVSYGVEERLKHLENLIKLYNSIKGE